VIGYKEFLKIFKKSGLKEGDLKRFYFSIRKSVILGRVGKRALPDLFKLEESCQWPVLQSIDNPDLSIYREADERLLEKFIGTIMEEKKLRQRKAGIGKVPYWSRLQSIIEERVELFTQIFGFDREDLKHCETVAERYAQIKDRKATKRKKMWQIGVGASAATLAGAAALWYISKKEHN